MDGPGGPSLALDEYGVKWMELSKICREREPGLFGAKLDCAIRKMYLEETLDSWATAPKAKDLAQAIMHAMARVKYARNKLGMEDPEVEAKVTDHEKAVGRLKALSAYEKTMLKQDIERTEIDIISKLRKKGVLEENDTLEKKYMKETVEKKCAEESKKRKSMAPHTNASKFPDDLEPEDPELTKQRKAIQKARANSGRTFDDPVSYSNKRQRLSEGRYKASGAKVAEVASNTNVLTDVSLYDTPWSPIADNANYVRFPPMRPSGRPPASFKMLYQIDKANGHIPDRQVYQVVTTANVAEEGERTRRTSRPNFLIAAYADDASTSTTHGPDVEGPVYQVVTTANIAEEVERTRWTSRPNFLIATDANDASASTTDAAGVEGQVSQVGETAEVAKDSKHTENSTSSVLTADTNHAAVESFQDHHQGGASTSTVDDSNGQQMQGLDQTCEAGKAVKTTTSKGGKKAKVGEITELTNIFEGTTLPGASKVHGDLDFLDEEML